MICSGKSQMGSAVHPPHTTASTRIDSTGRSICRTDPGLFSQPVALHADAQESDFINCGPSALCGCKRKRKVLEIRVSEQTIFPQHLSFAPVLAQYVRHKVRHSMLCAGLGREPRVKTELAPSEGICCMVAGQALRNFLSNATGGNDRPESSRNVETIVHFRNSISNYN
jgi:hypothetical protein